MLLPATRTVLHLTGSPVSEFFLDLSLLYARDCLTATNDPDRYETRIAHVTPDGLWRFPDDLSAPALDAADPMPLAAALEHIGELAIDVMVPQMFCVPGMTSYRALFDVLGVPYVGNTPPVMAIGADKALARAVVGAAGVDVPSGELLRAGDPVTLALPVVVKPVDADNSVGVSLARTRDELDLALADAFTHSSRALAESYVEAGREVRCGILERDGDLMCLPLEEYPVDATTRPIRTAADKIARDDAGGLNLMAKDAASAWILDPTDPITAPVWDAARRCHVAMGARHYSLFDFRVDPAGQPWFLEAGMYCSFARTSVVSVMAAAAGIELPELFDGAIERALAPGG